MSNTAEIKQRNLLEIVRAVCGHAPVTKQALAQLTELNSVTVHNYVTELVAGNLLVDDGNAESRGGRKATLYGINPRFRYFIGQCLGVGHIETCVCDFRLNQLYRRRVNYTGRYDEHTLQVLSSEINQAIEGSGVSRDKCGGVGLSVPGQVEPRKGVIINLSALPGWRRVPIRELLEGQVGLPVCVDNDNNNNALYAKRLPVARGKSCVVFFSNTRGMGMGILSEGKLHHGGYSTAGEIGHTSIDLAGPVCACGNKGCFEVFTSDQAIVGAYRRATGLDEAVSIAQVLEWYCAGNSAAREVLSEAARYIAIALEHVVKLYGADVILVETSWLKKCDDLFSAIKEHVYQKCTWVSRSDLVIVHNPIPDIEVVAAANLAYQNFLEPSSRNPLAAALLAEGE